MKGKPAVMALSMCKGAAESSYAVENDDSRGSPRELQQRSTNPELAQKTLKAFFFFSTSHFESGGLTSMHTEFLFVESQTRAEQKRDKDITQLGQMCLINFFL